RDQVGAGGVDVHDFVPQVQRGFEERHGRGDAGDVGQSADGGKVACGDFGRDGVVGGIDGCFVGDVDLVAERRNVELVADFRGDLGGPFAVEVQDDNGPA